MNMYIQNLSKQTVLSLCLVVTPYCSFGMEKEESRQSFYQNGADFINRVEGVINLANNGEMNKLCTHSHLQGLVKKSLLDHNEKAYEELLKLTITGSSLATGYLEYHNDIKYANNMFEKYKTNRLRFSSILSEAIKTLVFTVKVGPAYVESTADKMIDILNTPVEWGEYYCFVMPLIEKNNKFVLELFNDVCYKSIQAISWIKAYVSTLKNPDEYDDLLLLNKIIDSYENVYLPHKKATLSSVDIIPTDIPKTRTNHTQFKNHNLEECYSKIKIYEGILELLKAEAGSNIQDKTKAKAELIIIRKSPTFKTYDKNQPKDQGYFLRLVEAKPVKLWEWGQANRDTKDPVYAVDCYMEAGDTRKAYKKAYQQLDSVRKGRDYQLCYSALQKDAKLDFSKFKFEYYLAQRDYLLGLYLPNAQQKQVTKITGINQEVIHSKSIAQNLEQYHKSEKQVAIMEKNVSKKQKIQNKQLEELAKARDQEQKAKEELSKHLESIKNEEDELRELEKQIAELDIIPECDGEVAIGSDKDKSFSSIQKINEPKNTIIGIEHKAYEHTGGNESGEVGVLLNRTPTNSMIMSAKSVRRINSNQSTYEILPLNREIKDEKIVDHKETKTTIEPKARKTLSLLTRRNSTNSFVPEKKSEEKRERKSLIRTQSVIDVKNQTSFGEVSEEKDKKDKKTRKSINNSRNNANPSRALKVHKSEKKLERKNSQQNLSLNCDGESESELSVGGRSKNKYIQEGKRDIDLNKLKNLLNDRDLVMVSDVKLTDSIVRRVLRDLADRKIISWSGQRPKSKDDKLTATHHQNPGISMTIHLHGDWWLDPAIKVHFLTFVRQCDSDIDSLLTEIEEKKSKK